MFTSLANPPLHDGAIFKKIEDIPYICDGDQYIDNSDGTIWVTKNGTLNPISSVRGPFDGARKQLAQVLERSRFIEIIQELAIFEAIDKKEYFNLKKLYESKDADNRLLASNMVSEFHNKLKGE